MYSQITIVIVEFTCCFCFSNYDIFQGFDIDQSNLEAADTTEDPKTTHITYFSQTSELYSTLLPSSIKDITSNITTYNINSTSKPIIKTIVNCPEEHPANIGYYEVPTEKDLVIFTKDLLLSMFESYERESMSLLRDIKQATKAAAAIENKCLYKTPIYKQCVKLVSSQSERITKALVNALESVRNTDYKDLIQNSVCSLSEMKTDPMTLVKFLAQERAMLKFALPGFLRLLNFCYVDCVKESHATAYAKKPLHRLTDQELVVKYFLTNKNYIELIKDSRRNV